MTVEFNVEEMELVREFAAVEGRSTSEYIRDAVLEKIEDLSDLGRLRRAVAEDDGERHSHEEGAATLGLA